LKTLFASEGASEGGRSATNQAPNGLQNVTGENLHGGIANMNTETKP
jgi:hypothetical protein